MVAHTFNPRPRKNEAEGCLFKATLGYTRLNLFKRERSHKGAPSTWEVETRAQCSLRFGGDRRSLEMQSEDRIAPLV